MWQHAQGSICFCRGRELGKPLGRLLMTSEAEYLGAANGTRTLDCGTSILQLHWFRVADLSANTALQTVCLHATLHDRSTGSLIAGSPLPAGSIFSANWGLTYSWPHYHSPLEGRGSTGPQLALTVSSGVWAVKCRGQGCTPIRWPRAASGRLTPYADSERGDDDLISPVHVRNALPESRRPRQEHAVGSPSSQSVFLT